MSAVESTLAELEAGDHASSGRDFGRGVAYATRLVRDAVAADKREAARRRVETARLLSAFTERLPKVAG